MRRAFAFLVLCSVGVGCAKRGRTEVVAPPPELAPLPTPPALTEPVPEPRPATEPPLPEPDSLVEPVRLVGGHVGVRIGLALTREALVRTHVGLPLTERGLLGGPPEFRPADSCWALQIASGRRLPDGTLVDSRRVLRAWNLALGSGPSPAHFLLAFVGARDLVGDDRRRWLEAPGVRATASELLLCPDGPLGDIPERLAHPALWFLGEPGRAGLEGPGPFAGTPDGSLVRNPGFSGTGPYLERIVPVDGQGDTSLLFRLGDVHVAEAYGREAGVLLAAGSDAITVRRAPQWDRTYFLWFDPNKRWINDPNFRSWFSKRADRDEILRYLFDGRGDQAFTLHDRDAVVPPYANNDLSRPLAATSVPRLRLSFDGADPHAERIAERLTALLAVHRVELQPRPLPLSTLLAELAQGDTEIALLVDRPATADPVLALLESVWWLGPGARPQLLELLDATTIPDPVARRQRAAEIELEFLVHLSPERRSTIGTVVPLVRVHAWLAHHPKLAGLELGPDGVLRLDEAWWLP